MSSQKNLNSVDGQRGLNKSSGCSTEGWLVKMFSTSLCSHRSAIGNRPPLGFTPVFYSPRRAPFKLNRPNLMKRLPFRKDPSLLRHFSLYTIVTRVQHLCRLYSCCHLFVAHFTLFYILFLLLRLDTSSSHSYCM